MGGEEGSAKYREQLEGELEELYGHYKVLYEKSETYLNLRLNGNTEYSLHCPPLFSFPGPQRE